MSRRGEGGEEMATREEAETVITWTAADRKATVYSLVPRVWRMCERAGAEEIEFDRGTRRGKKVARTFLVDPGCIVIRKPRRLNLTPQQRAERALRFPNAPSEKAVGAHDAPRTTDGPERAA